MSENVYLKLKEKSDTERDLYKKAKPKRTVNLGVFSLMAEFDHSKADLWSNGVKEWTKIAMSTIVSTANEIGWERYINAMSEKQRPAVAVRAKELIEELELEGSSPVEAFILAGYWAKGCDFMRHVTIDYAYDNCSEQADWCPQVEAIRHMGLSDQAGNIRFWCDSYDQMIVQPLSGHLWYSHGSCILKGDNFCKARVIKDPDVEAYGGDNFFEVIKKMNSRYEGELAQMPYEERYPVISGIFPITRNLEDWTEEDLNKDGVIVKGGIAQENLLLAASELGWEKFINLVSEKQSWGMGEAAKAQKVHYEITGTSLRDAGTLAILGYKMLGFFQHELFEYTKDRIEVMGKGCPIVDRANNMNVSAEQVSLWCDLYHNHRVKAVNPDCNLTHTHCLGGGDQFCRFVIE